MTGPDPDAMDILLDNLQQDLALAGLAWHRIEGPKGIAMFPSVPVHTAGSAEQRVLEDSWEQIAVTQNAEADRLEVANRLEPKPLENTFAARSRIARGS